MTLLLAKTTGVQKSRIRLSDKDLIMISMPIPLISPQEIPITGFLSVIILLKSFQLTWACKVINYDSNVLLF